LSFPVGTRFLGIVGMQFLRSPSFGEILLK
jgi:hypothetical protein